MDDVLVPSAGFILVEITDYGHIRTCSPPKDTIHRETRHVHYTWPVSPALSDLKPRMVREDHAILELTSEGGGRAIWMRDSQRELLEPRIHINRTCYGKWPIMPLNEEE